MDTSTRARVRLADLRGFTILVVEDDADTLELLRAILTACGARVLLASSVQHARGYLQTARPDLVISDLAMPAEDGLALVRWLRANPATDVAGLPVIALTAFYEDYPRSRAQDFAAYFCKPVPIDALCRTVSDVLGPPRPRH